MRICTVPERAMGIVVASNSGDVAAVTRTVLDTVMLEIGPPARQGLDESL
jgi:hypothetical protein